MVQESAQGGAPLLHGLIDSDIGNVLIFQDFIFRRN